MPTLKIIWTQVSKAQFDKLRQRALDADQLQAFVNVHNKIVSILSDLEQATEKGDPLYHTKKPGGIVRHFMREFISVTYCVFPKELVGWVTAYLPVPATWPDPESRRGQNGREN